MKPLARVLGALRERGTAATQSADDPIRWDGVCPVCGGPLEVREVLWQDRGLRVRLRCSSDDENAILAVLGLREADLHNRQDDQIKLTRQRRRAADQLGQQLADVLGVPVIADGGRRFMWPCPACRVGAGDFCRPLNALRTILEAAA